MVSELSAWPVPKEAPEDADLSRCVHCGLCLTSCPTYAVTGLEAESPRGRIYLARGVSEGTIPLTETVQQHWDLCLQCRACEAVCPSGVPYGRIMEHTRSQMAATPRGKVPTRRMRRFMLRNVIARPTVLRVAMTPARIAANLPLRRSGFVRKLIGALPLIGRLEAQLPERAGRPVRPGDQLPKPATTEADEAIIFTGCVMGELFGDVHRATARVLARRDVCGVAAEGQACCGALHAHDGDLDFARKLARKNIDGLGESGPPIVVNSAGCGAAMKEYGDLLADDPQYAKRAERFASRVRDFSEYVATLEAPPSRLDGTVSYQHACHLAHAQRIREQPMNLVRGVEGAEPIVSTGDDMCCGAAGIYSLVQPEMSDQLRSRKADIFAEAKPDYVVTANPGCHLQYNSAVRRAGVKSHVMHVAEYLDEAERNAEAR